MKKSKKTIQQKLNEGRQFRYVDLGLPTGSSEHHFDTDYYVEGYAATFDPYVLYEDDSGAVYEEFKRSGIDSSDMDDVIFVLNHEGRVFARTSNQTLKLWTDDHGLGVAVDLSKTEGARQIYEDISTGMLTRMSWSFMPQDYDFDRQSRTLIHNKVKKIYDVSVVSIPANDGTSISARNFGDGVITEYEKEFSRLAKQRQRTQLRIRLGETK